MNRALSLFRFDESWILGLLIALWLAGIAAALTQADLVVFGALAGIPVVAIAIAFMLRVISGNRAATLVLFTLSLIMLAAVFRIREYEDKSLDFQVLMKLGSWALLAGVIFARFRTHFAVYLNGSAGLWLLLYLWMALTAAYSPAPVPNAVAVFSLAVFHMFTVYTLSFNSERSIAFTIILAALFLCAVSIVVYFVNPSFGRMWEWVNGVRIPQNRMRGITGSPNAIGGVAAFGILLISIFWREFGPRMRLISLAAVVVFAASIFFSQSRSPIAAALVILIGYHLFRPGRGPLVIICGVFGGALLLALIPFMDNILSLLSRSGRVEEILTATGRSYIWETVLRLWSEKPLTGWGYGAMLYVLPSQPGLFDAAAHAHNLFLEVLVGTGLIGFVILIMAVVSTLFWGFRLGEARGLALVFFILLRGLTEAAPFSGVAGFTYISLCLGVAIISRRQTEHRYAAAQNVRPRRVPGLLSRA